MKIHRIYAIYFSATGNTRRACTVMARAAAGPAGLVPETIDFTTPGCRKKTHVFSAGDLVLFGTPVYAGRVPNVLLNYIRTGFVGNGAFAVPLVTYGNRAYDDALYELSSLLTDDGFSIAAAAAIPAQHAFTAKLAAGRPDAEDLAALRAFGGRLYEKISADDYTAPLLQLPCPNKLTGYYRPLSEDGTAVNFLHAKPLANPDLCEGCCMCAVLCPMEAIPRSEPMTTTGTCIHCHACITRCPRKARSLPDEGYLSHIRRLEQTCSGRKEIEYFE